MANSELEGMKEKLEESPVVEDQVSELIENVYLSVVENRSDSLGLQAVAFMAHLHDFQGMNTEQIRTQSADIIDMIRESFLDETEKLADLAVENGSFTLADMA